MDTLRKENYTVTLEIVAIDKGVPQMTSASLQMTITVINVNEFHPQFPQASDSVILPENATVNSEIYQASASDGDYGIFGTIVYGITAGDVDGYFSIAMDTGKITIKKELDREAFPNGFDLTIEAKGFSGAAPGDTMVLRVNITDINDNSPVFSAQVSAQAVSETAGVDDVIVQVEATDSDLGTNAQVSYDITAGNSDDLFKIDEETGEIKVKQSLDLEGNNSPQSLSYTLTIKASDGGIPSKSSTIDVEISITTENEFTPSFGNVSETISVMENASVNSEIYKATATDQDYGTDGQLEYSITAQNPAGYFTIDSGGTVTIAQALDREVTPHGVTLTIQATDKPSTGTAKSSTLKLIVQIADYNDNTPDFTTQISPQQVSEDASIGDVIAQVNATDADLGTNAKVSYDIIAGNSDDLFEIDGETGEIKVKQSLDLEGNNRPQSLRYTLTIEAKDGGSPQQASTMDVEISILSVNEYTPVFGNATDSVTVQENATVSTEVMYGIYILHNITWYGMVWYGMVWYGMAWHGMAWYGMVWYGMVWYGMVWYGMVWYGMVWYGMVWYGMVWYGMVWYGMVWYGMVWYGMVWYGMVWYGMVWYGMVWYGMAWYGMVWYGMVWYGMVWYGMVWYGMVWYGMVWYGMVW